MLTKLISFVIILAVSTLAQDLKKGIVTYISSQNIYVNFGNTAGILIGDTLFAMKSNSYNPVGKVKYLSSKSVAGELIGNITPGINEELFVFVQRLEDPQLKDEEDNLAQKSTRNDTLEIIPEHRPVQDNNIRGKISVQSYTGFNNYSSRSDLQRWRYTLSLNGENVNGSDFSFSNYIIFTYKTREWQKVKNDLFYGLKIYDLAIKYEPGLNDEIWFGRKLNKRLANIGSVDGLQYEKRFSDFYGGIIAGSKPDYSDLGFNLKLFQYGGFIGRIDSGSAGYMDNTISFIQQTNNSNTDRRFLYYQHSNNLFSNTNLFFSSEIDLYKKERGEAKSDFSLTSLFLSARYSPERWVSLNLSYDARKNVIYYESFKNFTDSVIENETRQGVRFGIGLRPFKNIFLGFNTGYRYRPGDIKPSININGYCSFSNMPVILSSSNFSYTYLTGSYLEGNIWDISLYKDLPLNNTVLSVTYRRSVYTYSITGSNSIQDNFLLDVSTRLLEKIFFSISWDATFEKQMTLGRILLNVTTRF
jgi:hypothetical protein